MEWIKDLQKLTLYYPEAWRGRARFQTPPPTAPPSHITQVQPKVQTLFPPSAPPMDLSDD